MHPVESYLSEMGTIRATRAGTGETSYYPALATLLNEIGKTLAPKVSCVIQLQNRGAGLPDGGLFTADQCRHRSRAGDGDLFSAQTPSRGVIEAKSPRAALPDIVGSEQVERYWKRYGMVLVTNFRAFALVGKDSDGRPRELETFELAPDEAGFWALAAHPRRTADEQGGQMLEYLKRVLLHNAPLAAPPDVAGLLASYAHDARLRVERADLPALASLRQALEQALGLRFEGGKGEHFFRSTLVQTLFYGVFSAWVLWSRRRAARHAGDAFAAAVRENADTYRVAGAFDWRSAHFLLRVPMLRALFVQVADPARLGALGLIEVLDWAAAALNRVDRDAFFASFDEGHAVQYFYEPFLQAFDPDLRKELGVWYTPEEIVRYQVERVDTALRAEHGLADGLADPRVVVLDPCCGTGAYLRAVLRRIAATLHDKGGDALVAHDLKQAAMTRVFGFEILPAPFVIAHLQLGLELETLGAPLSDRADPPERAGVYLTNALTGWEPPREKPRQIAFPGFDDERDAAGQVKHRKPILVILGNPPYNAFAGISPEEENGLVEPYKQGLVSEWGIKKFNLDDLYIRFFRLAEKRIAEHGGRGVVSFISPHSWVSEPSFVVLRRHLLDSFDRFWIENMHGNRKISEYAPDGRTSETVFAVPGFSVGIQQGIVISLWVKHAKRKGEPVVRLRNDIDDAKATDRRARLLASLDAKKFDAQYEIATPARENRWSFRPADVTAAYLSWPKVSELCAAPSFNGPVERRAFALISMDRAPLAARMKAYFDKGVSNDDVAALHPALMMTGNRIVGPEARAKLLRESAYDESRIVRYPFKPFDLRWCYLDNIRPLFSEPSPQLLSNRFSGNLFFITRDTADKGNEGPPFLLSPFVCDYDCISGHARHFPVCLRKNSGDSLPGFDGVNTTANLSPSVRAYLASLGLPDPDADQETAELIWHHALAIGFASAYLTENADGIRQDWPRIPLPGWGATGTAGRIGPPQRAACERLLVSAALGRRIAALLDSEAPVPGVTCGAIRDDLKGIAVFRRLDGQPARPEAGDLDVTAGWGHAGTGGVTMPGRGKVLPYTSPGSEDHGRQSSRQSSRQSEIPLNPEPRTLTPSLDIYLNDSACWRNVPEAVWSYTIGGYQVVKKWLSYREKPLLGRGLTPDEVRHVTDTCRRLAALIGMQEELDRNYAASREG